MPRQRAAATPVDPQLVENLPSVSATALAGERVELERVRVAGEDAELHAPRLSLDTVRCEGLRIAAAHLPRLRAYMTWWEDCDLSNADMSNADIRHAVLRRSRLTGLGAVEASLRDVLVESCKLDLANWRFAHLERVEFRACVLSDADFSSATLRTVRFDGCDLSAAQFAHAVLDDVDLRGSQLERIGGLDGLRGARIGNEQLLELAPALAAHLGLHVED
jgi:uncharacterized protein YjbI with pentapeptide repeats